MGKSVICSALCHGLLAKEVVHYWKPIQTGGASVDRDFVMQSCGANLKKLNWLPEMYTYDLPASPNQAALQSQSPGPQFTSLLSSYEKICNELSAQQVIIEGVGGVQVPLDSAMHTWLDFAEQTMCPTVVVAKSGLGTLNHTILTIEALLQRACSVVGLVMFGEEHSNNRTELRKYFLERHGMQMPIYSFICQREDDLQKIIPLESSKLVNFLKMSLEQSQKKHKFKIENVKNWDAKHVWHPYTQHYQVKDFRPLERAKRSLAL